MCVKFILIIMHTNGCHVEHVFNKCLDFVLDNVQCCNCKLAISDRV